MTSHDFAQGMLRRDLEKSAIWAKTHSVCLIAIWGAWVIVLTPFDISSSYRVMAQLGERWTGFYMIGLGIASYLLARRPCGSRIAGSYLVQAVAFGSICASFAAGEWRSTGVLVYGVLAAYSLISARQMLLLPPHAHACDGCPLSGRCSNG